MVMLWDRSPERVRDETIVAPLRQSAYGSRLDELADAAGCRDQLYNWPHSPLPLMELCRCDAAPLIVCVGAVFRFFLSRRARRDLATLP